MVRRLPVRLYIEITSFGINRSNFCERNQIKTLAVDIFADNRSQIFLAWDRPKKVNVQFFKVLLRNSLLCNKLECWINRYSINHIYFNKTEQSRWDRLGLIRTD